MGALNGFVGGHLTAEKTKTIEGVSGTIWWLRWRPDARRRAGGEWMLAGFVQKETNQVIEYRYDLEDSK